MFEKFKNHSLVQVCKYEPPYFHNFRVSFLFYMLNITFNLFYKKVIFLKIKRLVRDFPLCRRRNIFVVLIVIVAPFLCKITDFTQIFNLSSLSGILYNIIRLKFKHDASPNRTKQFQINSFSRFAKYVNSLQTPFSFTLSHYWSFNENIYLE